MDFQVDWLIGSRSKVLPRNGFDLEALQLAQRVTVGVVQVLLADGALTCNTFITS